MLQEFLSKETSINTVNSVYKKGYFKAGDEILDYGGGKYDKNTEYLRKLGIKCFVFDPFNRGKLHNEKVINYFEEKQGAENIVCSNVLCVIKEDEVILDVLTKIYNISNKKKGSRIFIQIYEGNKSGIGKVTSKGYQRNQKAIYYFDFIYEVFGETVVITKDKNIYELIFK